MIETTMAGYTDVTLLDLRGAVEKATLEVPGVPAVPRTAPTSA